MNKLARGYQAAQPESVIELHRVKVRLGKIDVLNIEHLAVRRGEVLGIIGPNGSGKSTLLRVMALLQQPTEGEIIFSGTHVNAHSNKLAMRRNLAIVFQEALLLNASVFDNVATGLRFRGLPRDLIKDRVNTWLSQLGIEHLQDRSARRLSGGEAQRVSLARALALGPEVLLLDEPFAALDPPTRMTLLEDLERILSETGISTVFVTHDRTEAMILAQRLAVMMGGQIPQLDSPEEVFSSPCDERVASFVGIETILPGQVVREQDGLAFIDVGPCVVQVVGQCRPNQKALVCIRPENITIAPHQGAGALSSARNTLPGTIVRASPLGPLMRVVVDCGVVLIAVITRQSYQDLSLTPGASILASFKATAAHIIVKD